jgi:HCOMODA/2-hydroxy-3-carboxy-muconic semialdehyde decarboxylase
MIFDLDGNAINDDRKPYLERFIHGEIYRQRPDVMAVVHSHSASVVPFSVVKSNPLRAMCHMSGFIGKAAPIFEIREAGGDATDLLISNQHLGSALASSLADHPAILMRGHGSTVVAENLKKAVYRAVYLEVNAKAQAEASRLGEIEFLTQEEAATAMENIKGQADRPWQLWKLRAKKARQSLLS